MEVTRYEDAAVAMFSIRGELDALTAPQLRAEFDKLSENGPERVMLDLSQLRLIDSSGVGAIVRLFKRLRARGGSLGITGLSGQPRSIFELLRLDRVFDVS